MKIGGIGVELIVLIIEQCFDDLDVWFVCFFSQDIFILYNGFFENFMIIQLYQIVEVVQVLVNKGI